MQFVFQNQVNHFIGALAKLVQGVNLISQPKNQNHPELVEPLIQLEESPIADTPIADVPIMPVAEAPTVDLPIAEPVVSMEVLLTPWLPTIESIIAGYALTAPALMDFRPTDEDRSIAGNGTHSAVEIRDFSNLVSNFAVAVDNTDAVKEIADIGRALLSERSLSEDDFSHAVDQIFQHNLSTWQNN